MAVIKLGSIVTDIAGSIGGTTFRRTSTGHAVYNKQGSQIKSAFARTSRKNALANIFRAWGELDKATQDAWAENALIYKVPDRFGKISLWKFLFSIMIRLLLYSNQPSGFLDLNNCLLLAVL